MAYNHGLPNSHLIEGGGEACGRKMEMGRRRRRRVGKDESALGALE